MEKLRHKTEIRSDAVEVEEDRKKRNKNISHQTEKKKKKKTNEGFLNLYLRE